MLTLVQMKQCVAGSRQVTSAVSSLPLIVRNLTSGDYKMQSGIWVAASYNRIPRMDKGRGYEIVR